MYQGFLPSTIKNQGPIIKWIHPNQLRIEKQMDRNLRLNDTRKQKKLQNRLYLEFPTKALVIQHISSENNIGQNSFSRPNR